MNNPTSLTARLLIVLLVVGALAVLFAYRGYKDKEIEFDEKKATLIKHSLDLEDEIIVLQEALTENENTIASLETSVAELRRINEEGRTTLDALRERRAEQVRPAAARVVRRPETVTREPSPAEEEQYEVITPALGLPAAEVLAYAPERAGTITSINKRRALIMTDLGSRDRVKEGSLYAVLKDGKEIATAEVINVRYDVSAGMVSRLNAGYVLDDVSEGDQVILLD